MLNTPIDMTTYGYKGDNAARDAARVTAVHRARYEIVSAYGAGFAVLKGGAYYADGAASPFPTVGDFVRVQHNPDGDSLITQTLPRKTYFARSDYAGHAAGYAKSILQQAVAANFDTVLLLASLNHDLSVRRMERYLALALQSKAQPVAVLTKADLVSDDARYRQTIAALSRTAPVITLSAVTGEGVDALAPYLAPGQTVTLLGSSGVGKSTLLNRLAGEQLMDTGEIRQDDSRGRHTTTRRQLFLLPSGAMVIDTPGMRELGLWAADDGLEDAFTDVESVIARCRFSDCRHQSEPGCAVQKALAAGELDASRLESYLCLKKEMRFVTDKAAALRDKQAWHKQIARASRQQRKPGRGAPEQE